MKTIITTGLLCAAIGAVGGWLNAADHYEAKANKLAKETEKAEESRLLINKDVVDKLYEKYFETITADPIIVDRIVRVKATCPVQTNTSGSMDNAGTTTQVELERGVVRGVDAVADKHVKKYETCALQLRAAQGKLANTQISLD